MELTSIDMESKMPLLTIFTPTYNRADLLFKLYKSLREQRLYNFEWLIVDDGSTDHTSLVIEEIRGENQDRFPIRYYQKGNGGKHTAINVGVREAKGDLFFIVDSDDLLTPDAVSTITSDWQKTKSEQIFGISYLRGHISCPNNAFGHTYSQESSFIGNYIDVRYNRGVSGEDHAEIFRTELLRDFPFTEYPNERFMSEAIVWIRLGKRWKMLFVNKIIYLAEYVDGGLTLQGKRLRFQCPLGGIEGSLETMSHEFHLRTRIKQTLLYIVYSRFAQRSLSEIYFPTSEINQRQIQSIPHFRALLSMSLLPGLALYHYWRRKYHITKSSLC